jgi:hypothetical protein
MNEIGFAKHKRMRLGSALRTLTQDRALIPVIFCLGFLLRLFGSLRVGLVFDEQVWLEAAQKISLSPGAVRLPLHGAFHPLFEAYLIKLSMVLFGKNPLGLISPQLEALFAMRCLHVLLSSATIVVMYLLVREGAGRKAAAWAAGIVAFSQFHIHFSRTIIQTAPLLFFASLALLFFWKAVKDNSGRSLIIAGASTGLAYMCEETGALLWPIFFLFLVFSGRLKPWLKRWETYAAACVFVLFIAPDLAWNLSAKNPDIGFHLTRAASFRGPSLLPASLFVGELFLALVKDIFSFVGGFGRPPRWNVAYAPEHWVLGVMSLTAVAVSIRKWKDDFAKLLLIMFFFVFGFFTFFAAKGLWGNLNFWWASLSVIPAFALLGAACSDVAQKKTLFRRLPAVFLAYLFVHALAFLAIGENVYVRRPAFLERYYSLSGRDCLLRGEVAWAKTNFEKALKVEPRSVTNLVNLAECFRRMNRPGQAEDWERQARKIMPGIDVGSYGYDRGYLKEWLVDGPYPAPVSRSRGAPPDETRPSGTDSGGGVDKEKRRPEEFVSPSAFIDLKNLLKSPPRSSVFVSAQIYSSGPRQVRFLAGADDGLTLWLNHKKIYDNQEKYWWLPDEEAIPAKLESGWNALALEVRYNGGQYHGFSLRLADEAGNIIDRPLSRTVIPEHSALAEKASADGIGDPARIEIRRRNRP